MSIGRLSFCKTASYRIEKVESPGSLLGCRGFFFFFFFFEKPFPVEQDLPTAKSYMI